MKRFIKSSFFFLISIPVLYVITYSFLHRCFEQLRHKNNSRAVYVWGDSRTYRCVDVRALEKGLGRVVYGYASAGAGIYSFYVFAQSVPHESTIIVGPSLRMFVVNPTSENNESGLSLKGLLLAAQNGYPVKELFDICKLNHNPWESAFYRTNPAPYENNDVLLQNNLDWFEANYGQVESSPAHYYGKRKIFDEAIRLLLEKQCRILLIEMPVTDQLQMIREQSIYRDFSEELHDYGDHPLIHVTTDLKPPSDANYYYDLHHLNERGRVWLTKQIIDLLNEEGALFINRHN